MDEFYEHIIRESDRIIRELGCENVDQALAKLGDNKR